MGVMLHGLLITRRMLNRQKKIYLFMSANGLPTCCRQLEGGIRRSTVNARVALKYQIDTVDGSILDIQWINPNPNSLDSIFP